ncbi:type II toxin-antitoxin system Phd/YefM family antitoxin [Candidatus Falkowbacteria bacterium]|nr:type II toxin-antitoxin system Phd/YefM family antitoxin [Candidatus Falkowbacteria bacterium]
MTRVNLKEFRQNLDSYYQKVKDGESIIVTRRTEDLFKISPINTGAWEEVIDFTKLQRGGVNINDLLKRL